MDNLPYHSNVGIAMSETIPLIIIFMGGIPTIKNLVGANDIAVPTKYRQIHRFRLDLHQSFWVNYNDLTTTSP